MAIYSSNLPKDILQLKEVLSYLCIDCDKNKTADGRVDAAL